MRPVYIPVGHIVNAHGIKGEVKLNPEGFTPEFVAEFDTLYINGESVQVKSRRVPQVHGASDSARGRGYGRRPGPEGPGGLHPGGRMRISRRGEYFDAELVGAMVLG